MKICVNGTERTYENSLTVAELLQAMELATKQVAVEVNQKIVPCEAMEQTRLNENDAIEIVHFVGGG